MGASGDARSALGTKGGEGRERTERERWEGEEKRRGGEEERGGEEANHRPSITCFWAVVLTE